MHGYVSVPALMDALAWAALRHGVQIEAAHRVTGIRVERRGVTISHRGRHLVVRGRGGDRRRAAGRGRLDVDDAAASAVRPVRGQLLRLHWRGAPLNHIVWGPDCYVVPWQNQTVLVGATVEDVGFDERTTAAGVQGSARCGLRAAAGSVARDVPRSARRPAPGHADGLPFLGPSQRSDRI